MNPKHLVLEEIDLYEIDAEIAVEDVLLRSSFLDDGELPDPFEEVLGG